MEGINLIQKENLTGEQRQKNALEGGEIIGDYLEKIKRLENISYEKQIRNEFLPQKMIT